MTNLKKRIISAAAAGVMALNVVTPALATEIVISGNGANSDNEVAVQTVNTTVVNQSNNANVTNKVKSDADTGENKANYNTGGNVGIQTGDAKVTANVSNNLNSNHAEVDCCAANGADVTISGNGAKSDNKVNLTNVNATTLGQANTATVNNDVDADADSGDNDAGYNTGGDVVILTGSAKTNVDVSTTANVNSAKIGNGHSATPTPSASFMIIGNGAHSDNTILAGLTNATVVGQTNTANVTNDVDAEAESGDNDANFNTGGDVVIMTGDAKTHVDVDTAVNFNAADIDCGCEFDVLAKIAGNGAESYGRNHDENYIGVNLANTQAVGQGNNAYLTNDVEDDADSGDNEASKNTGAVDHETDPAVVTGDAESHTSVSNSGNVNVLGDLPFDMPDFPEVDVDFNLSAVWAWMFMGMSF